MGLKTAEPAVFCFERIPLKPIFSNEKMFHLKKQGYAFKCRKYSFRMKFARAGAEQ
jgi:hypothetical protein